MRTRAYTHIQPSGEIYAEESIGPHGLIVRVAGPLYHKDVTRTNLDAGRWPGTRLNKCDVAWYTAQRRVYLTLSEITEHEAAAEVSVSVGRRAAEQE